MKKKKISLCGVSLDWTTAFEQSVSARQVIVYIANTL